MGLFQAPIGDEGLMSSSTSSKPVSTAKRNRTSSQSSGSSTRSRQHVAHKSTRISASPPAEDDSDSPAGGGTHPLLCTLPPTCNHKPTPLASTKELESHYATYHAHVCEQCGCVFPDARLLELHQTENHDPIASMRKERGEKIFACHLASCLRLFANPKARRLHLISAHGYPKEYFFAVTNKGVGGLLKKWGEGASMVRGKWSPREPDDNGKPGGDGRGPPMQVDKETMREKMDVDSDEDEEDEDSSSEEEQLVNPKIYTTITESDSDSKPRGRAAMDQDPEATPRPPVSSSLPPAASPPPFSKPLQPARPRADPDSLSAGFSALSLVPPSVRFGRGGKVGFAGGPRPAQQRQPSQPETLPDVKPAATSPAPVAGGKREEGLGLGGGDKRGRGSLPNRGRRGRGFRGRGGG